MGAQAGAATGAQAGAAAQPHPPPPPAPGKRKALAVVERETITTRAVANSRMILEKYSIKNGLSPKRVDGNYPYIKIRLIKARPMVIERIQKTIRVIHCCFHALRVKSPPVITDFGKSEKKGK